MQPQAGGSISGPRPPKQPSKPGPATPTASGAPSRIPRSGASVGPSLRLTTRVDVKFYDVAGPYLAIGAYAASDIGASVPNGLDWVARAGVDAMFGGDVAVLGKTLAEYNRSLFDVARDFAQ